MKHRARPGRGGLFSRRGSFGGREDDFSRGRKFNSEDLRGLLLALLVEESRHGYDLMRLLESRSNGYYTPSPGMVYPALAHLAKIGHGKVAAEGNRKRYAITEEGRAYVEANRERIGFLLAKLEFFAQKMGLVRRALAGDDANVAEAATTATAATAASGSGPGPATARATAAEAGDDAHDARGRGLPLDALREARDRLEHLVMAGCHASTGEQLRIAQILERAAADIAAADTKRFTDG